MASIRITRYEAQHNLLPPVCVVTGEPTSETKRHTFRWTPPWVGVLILVPLLYIICALVLRKDITFDVPLASRKRGHWLWRQVFVLLGVLGCIGLVIAGIALSNEPNGVNRGPDIGLITAGAAGVGLVLVIVVAVILQYTSIRPKEITDRDITLVGVHENFVAALEEERDRDEEEEADRKAARREQEKRRGDEPRPRRDGGDEPPRARRLRADD